jgi:hypothetical protein
MKYFTHIALFSSQIYSVDIPNPVILISNIQGKDKTWYSSQKSDPQSVGMFEDLVDMAVQAQLQGKWQSLYSVEWRSL